jgi:hypothetical protein
MLLWLACFKSMRLPTDLFREYFGDRVSLYFEVTEGYIRTLQPLAVAGVVLWLIEAVEARRGRCGKKTVPILATSCPEH